MRIARLVILLWLVMFGSAWAQCSVANLFSCPSPPFNLITAAQGKFFPNGTITWDDTTTPRTFNQFTAFSGTSSDVTGQSTILNRFQTNDQINYTGPQFSVGYNFEDAFGGGSSAGAKFGVNMLLLQQGANADTGADHFYVGLTTTAFARFTPPGSSSTAPLGRLFALGSNAQIQPGFVATNWLQIASYEADVAISPGSSASLRDGIAIVNLGHTTDPTGYWGDNALWFYGPGAPWRYGINFSDTQKWPIDDTIGTILGANYGAGRNAAPDMSAQWGVDFMQVAFPHTGNPYDGAMIRGSGWSIDGIGNAQFGTTYFTSSSTGIAIDAKGSIGQSAVIATAGSGYEIGVLVFGGDAASYGGLWTVTTSGGVPTGAVTELVHPVFATTSSPPTTITPTNRNLSSQGSGFQITETWNTTATSLSLQPSGGALIMAGLPTSAPAAHCRVWSNSGVLTLTTCP